MDKFIVIVNNISATLEGSRVLVSNLLFAMRSVCTAWCLHVILLWVLKYQSFIKTNTRLHPSCPFSQAHHVFYA